jgi:hypothetical protein
VHSQVRQSRPTQAPTVRIPDPWRSDLGSFIDVRKVRSKFLALSIQKGARNESYPEHELPEIGDKPT